MFKIFIKKNKFLKTEIIKEVNKIILTRNDIDINCPNCSENIGSFSYNYIEKYKKIFCNNCEKFIDIDISFNKNWEEKFLDGGNYIKNYFSKEDNIKFLVDSVNLQQIKK